MNAIAHAVEALYAKDANPVVSLMAEEGIRALSRSLPRLMEQPQDRDPRRCAIRRLVVRLHLGAGRHGAAP